MPAVSSAIATCAGDLARDRIVLSGLRVPNLNETFHSGSGLILHLWFAGAECAE